MPFSLEPLVAGELGEGTQLDASTHPPKVAAVEYLLDAPTDDDLIESFPVFLVSDWLAERLVSARLEGFVLDDARVVPSREYKEVYGSAPHKSYRWLRLVPSVTADSWLDQDYQLCVSDRMMDVLREGVLDGSDVTQLAGSRRRRVN
jgi:hypothetical protein